MILIINLCQYPDPNERGLLWATRFSGLWKAFSLRPMDLYKSAFYGYWGNKIDKGCDDSKPSSQGYDFECAALEKPQNIAGISACLWTEEIIGMVRLVYNMYCFIHSASSDLCTFYFSKIRPQIG